VIMAVGVQLQAVRESWSYSGGSFGSLLDDYKARIMFVTLVWRHFEHVACPNRRACILVSSQFLDSEMIFRTSFLARIAVCHSKDRGMPRKGRRGRELFRVIHILRNVESGADATSVSVRTGRLVRRPVAPVSAMDAPVSFVA